MHRSNAEGDRAHVGERALTLPKAREDVAAYYDEKTARILAKYGPGPRVHYHTGITGGEVHETETLADVRARIVASQEALLAHVGQHVPATREPMNLLDVGCGLGGGSLYWAATRDASVTAVTIVPAHVRVVRRLADEAGVGHLVHPVLCDAHYLPGFERFDAAVAIESSCYMDRGAWLRRLASLLKRGATAHIADWFVGRPEAAAPVDAYFRTRMGRPEEYFEAAESAGFRVRLFETLDDETEGFWSLSIAWSHRELATRAENDEAERARLATSIVEHARLGAAFRDGGLRYGHLVLERA